MEISKEIDTLLKSIALYNEKHQNLIKSHKPVSVNKRLNPVLARQLKSIIKQAANIDKN